MIKSTKRFIDFPCTHRAWRTEGHCRFIHGYSRSFHFTFSCSNVDENGWVMDFSGLKKVKAFLTYWFDHTFLVAKDDPEMDLFQQMDNKGLIQLRIMKNPSMEGTAKFVLKESQNIVNTLVKNRRVIVERVEVFENEKNSSIAFSDYNYIDKI